MGVGRVFIAGSSLRPKSVHAPDDSPVTTGRPTGKPLFAMTGGAFSPATNGDPRFCEALFWLLFARRASVSRPAPLRHRMKAGAA
jgi:hypothetical protein